MSMNYYNPYDPYSGMFGYSPGAYNPYQTMADQGWAQIGNTATQNANQAQYWQGSLANQASQSAGDLALRQQMFGWQQDLDRAAQTGMWNGQYNMPSNQWFSGAFGTWMPGGPTAGQQTAAYQNQLYNQGQGLAGLYGRYFAPGEAPTSGEQTQAAQAQQFGQNVSAAGLTGLYNGQQTQQAQQQAFAQDLANRQFGLSQQTQQQQAANQYLSLLSSLRGPADWAKYQQVLNAGGSMNDLAAQAMGAYIPGGGATSGVQPQAANLNTLYGQVQGASNAALLGPQAQQFTEAHNQQFQQPTTGYANIQGGQSVAANPYTPGTPVPGSQPGLGEQQWAAPNINQRMDGGTAWQQYANQQQMQAAGNGTNTMGAQQNQYNLPAPNQIAAQSWRNMQPSQQQMLLGQYEAQGWHKPDVENMMNQALPKYASNAPTAGTFRLR